jgi:hypothetical protein
MCKRELYFMNFQGELLSSLKMKNLKLCKNNYHFIFIKPRPKTSAVTTANEPTAL